VRFAFVESLRHVWRMETICRVAQVSPRGYRSWRSRPVSQRMRTEMRVLAHIREQYSLSLESYPDQCACAISLSPGPGHLLAAPAGAERVQQLRLASLDQRRLYLHRPARFHGADCR
jgi:hypothetical protein